MVWFIYKTQFYHYYETHDNGIHFKGLNETILMVPITRMYNLYWQNAYGVEVLQKSQKRIKSSIGKRWVAAWIHIVEKNGLQIWNQHKISHNMSWENQNILQKGVTSPPPKTSPQTSFENQFPQLLNSTCDLPYHVEMIKGSFMIYWVGTAES